MKDYSNYHQTNSTDKLTHDGLLLLERSLNGFEGYDALVNSTKNTKVMIYQKWDSDSETKKVIGHIADIERGSLLKVGNDTWLITTLPEDNKVYRKAEMKLCNATFPIQSNKTQILVDYDSEGRPIFQDSYETTSLPCVATDKLYVNNADEQLPLPEGKLLIIVQFKDFEMVKENYEFTMYNSAYKVTSIDYTKVVNNKGYITIHADKVVS